MSPKTVLNPPVNGKIKGLFKAFRVRATDRHCRKMRRNNKFGAKNINLATTIGERKIASKIFCLASESSPPAPSHCLVPLNGHQCVS